MKRVESASAALRDCEAVLRRLVAEAAAEGDYEAVIKITGWATSLRHLSAGQPLEVGRSHAQAQPSRSPARRTAVPARSARPRSRAASPPSSVYPRFIRRESELVKIGWSKRSHSEYEHRASRQMVNRTVELLIENAKDDELLRIEALLPAMGVHENMPIYQVYVVLAWLRAEDLVKQHGRQGYSLVDARALRTQIEDRWQALPAA
jgi:hypothetical protein